MDTSKKVLKGNGSPTLFFSVNLIGVTLRE